MEVGDLAVVLDARTKEFRAALDQAEKRIAKFEKTAEKGATEAGRGFDKLGGRLGGLKSAVTGLIAAFGAWKALQLGKEATLLAAEYESIEIQLGTLTGSAENAAAVMANVNRVVLETPYSLEQMGRAAASSALIFKDNTDAVNEFTAHVADLAAAFNRPIELIGENLPRAFSAGLGAADAFREAGISGYILELSGKTKVADVTTQDLIESIRKMTSEGGIAYRAASRQADSLRGVLSNTGIAADNLKRAFGEALSPAIVKTGKEVLQPFFERLKQLVDENKAAIEGWAESLGIAVDWMTRIVDSGPRGYAEMVDKAAELRQEIADLNRDLGRWEKLTLGISWLQAEGGKQRLIQLETELMKTEALIRAEEQRMAAAAGGRKVAPGRPEAAIDIGALPGAGRGKDTLRELKGMAEMAEVFGENAASAYATLQATGTAASGLAWALRDAANEAARVGGPLEGLGTAIGQDIREGVQSGLVEGLKEGKLGASDVLMDLPDTISTRFLETGVGEMTKGLEDGFSDLFDDLGPKLGEALGLADMGPLSGAVQGALSTAAGIGLSMVMRAIGGARSRQTFAQIQGAPTTDVREMRGIAVGETTVGIAEIAPRLEDALAPLTGIAAEHLRVTRGILAALSSGYTRGAGAALDVEVGALLENSPSLTY